MDYINIVIYLCIYFLSIGIDRGMAEVFGCINWVVNWCFICLYWFIYLFIRLSIDRMNVLLCDLLINLFIDISVDWLVDWLWVCYRVFECLMGWWVDSLDISFSVAYLWFNYDLNDWLSARSIGLFEYTYGLYMCVCVDVIMYGLVDYLFYYWYVCMHVWMYNLARTNWLIGMGCMNDWLRDCNWLIVSNW